ncbi:MAG: TlyA family RNA methyltransferase [Actinomycetes bacterium]
MGREGGGRVRLDSLLVQRGFFETRSRASASVIAGEVILGPGRSRASKPGQMVASDIEIALEEKAGRYVSRGGVKLANALDSLHVDPSGRSALDAGASTGGFTDCLLQRGASRVLAVDVAYGELAWSIRNDPRVEVRERTNARSLVAGDTPWPVDLIVCDLSFISLTKVLPALVGVASPGFDLLAMIKPQFEVGREAIGKGGVVRDPALRRSALVSVGEFALSLGVDVCGYASSGLPGPKGNLETFIHITDRTPARNLELIEELAATIEP